MSQLLQPHARAPLPSAPQTSCMHAPGRPCHRGRSIPQAGTTASLPVQVPHPLLPPHPVPLHLLHSPAVPHHPAPLHLSPPPAAHLHSCCQVFLAPFPSSLNLHLKKKTKNCRYAGLGCHLILRCSRQVVDQDPGLTGNLLVDRMVGAHLHLVRCVLAVLACRRSRCAGEWQLPHRLRSPASVWGMACRRWIRVYVRLPAPCELHPLAVHTLCSGSGLMLAVYIICFSPGHGLLAVDQAVGACPPKVCRLLCYVLCVVDLR